MTQQTMTIPATGTQLSVFTKEGFELVQRMALGFSKSSLVPKHYQGEAGVANCMIALNMACRMGSDPLMTMQNLYVVHGTPAWSAQFLIATFNSCGRFTAIRYEWQGTPGSDDWGCRAASTERDTGENLKGALITIAMAKAEGWHGKAGSKWKTMPEQMLMYRSAAWLVRAYCPEIAMGLHCADEVEDCDGPLNAPRSNGKARVMSSLELVGDAQRATEPEPAGEPDESPGVPITEQYRQQISECDTVETCDSLIPAITKSKQVSDDERKHLLELLAVKRGRIEGRKA